MFPNSPNPNDGPRGLGQRIAFACALAFYGGALTCLTALALRLGPLGIEHPVIASLPAAVVFFIGGGLVLHIIGRANLPDLGTASLGKVDDGQRP